MAEQIYHELASYNITRADLIVTLGGGVVGDLGGFCAATFLRGVKFIQIPTSLLAQVDSSVGGKVGINLPQGKNLVGSFYQPEAVLIDPETLDTLSDRYFADGMAEVIKYGCISSSRLFIQLAAFESKKDLIDNIEQVIYKCCDLKRRVVEKDELEGGHRRILNFGHTIGHVIEAYYNYEKYSHGEGVAIGMYHVTKKSVDEGITDEETLDNLKSILIKYNLPYEMPDIPKKDIKEIVMNDKKMEKEILHMVVITKIGRAKMVKVHKKNVLELFK
jgi:3-dehydroquinate synthase